MYNIKKAQGLSLHTIIIAIMVLIVLVVLVLIFTGKFGDFSAGLKLAGTCESLGGTCEITCIGGTAKTEVFGAIDCGKNLEAQGGKNKVSLPKCCKLRNPAE